MTKWEYRMLDSADIAGEGIFRTKSREAVETYLNRLGAEGWEIINIDVLELEGRRSFVGFAKRPL